MAVDLLYVALVFFIVAIVSYVLGARGFAWFTADIAKFIVWVFVILSVITIILRLVF